MELSTGRDPAVTMAGWILLIGFILPGAAYLVGIEHWLMIVLPFFGFWGLVGLGVYLTFLDVTGAVQKPREVHHYHRITIDQNGNPVEVTDYTQEH